MEAALTGQRQPVYSTILNLDKRIRDFDVPPQWRIPTEEDGPSSPEVSMYRWLVLSAKEIGQYSCHARFWHPSNSLFYIALLNLHRGYFAQALQEMPADLHRHRYLASVVSVYRSAWRLIRGLAMTWMVIPESLARVNLAWSQGLSAAVRAKLEKYE
jgi:hypothetical protein